MIMGILTALGCASWYLYTEGRKFAAATLFVSGLVILGGL